MDLTKPPQDEDDVDQEKKIVGDKIRGINQLPLEESSSEEEDEKGNPIPKKPKPVVPFNVASTVGFDEKKQKIDKLRKLHGEIIGSKSTLSPDLINNIFTS